VAHGMRCPARRAAWRTAHNVVVVESAVAEWIDTLTGEISRARIVPADRMTVRGFLARFDGAALEVAVAATTGWPFLVPELQRAGAEAHLAEPAETSGLKGKKQRAKTDWADARRQAPEQPRPALLRPARAADRRQPRVRRDRAQAAQTQLSRPARPRRSGAGARDRLPHVTRQAHRSSMNRGQFPKPCCRPRPAGQRPGKTERPHPICRNTPPHHVPGPGAIPESRAEVSMGVREHARSFQRAHAPHPDLGSARHPCRAGDPPSRRQPPSHRSQNNRPTRGG
jgi:hypothetical protein